MLIQIQRKEKENQKITLILKTSKFTMLYFYAQNLLIFIYAIDNPIINLY